MSYAYRKIAWGILCLLLALSAQAQTAIYAPKFMDGWSLTLGGGATHPLKYSFSEQLLAPIGEIALHKQLTPSLGMALEGNYSQGDHADTRTYHDRTLLTAMGTLNLSRWWGGYSGKPRRFEVVLKAGAGWGHSFDEHTSQTDYIGAKVGADFSVFLTKNRAWSLGLRPALLYNLRSGKAFEQIVVNHDQADWQCALSITYHFRNSRGGHHLAAVQPVVIVPVERTRVDEVIEDLQTATAQMREDMSQKDELIVKQQQRIAELERQSTVQAASPVAPASPALPAPVPQPKTREKKASERRVLLEERINFSQNVIVVAASEFPALERIAICMERNPQSTVLIQGFASPEGTPEINARVSQARADVVRTLLIAQYGIKRERIKSVGGGVSNSRMSLCTVLKD